MKIQRILIAAALAVVAASASAQGFPGGGPGGQGGPGGRGGMRMMMGGPGGGGVASADMLIMRQDVQEDLKLTDEQKEKLDELRKTMRPGGRGGPGGGGPGGVGGFGGPPPGGGPDGPPPGGPGGQGGGPGGPRGNAEFEAMRKKNTEAVLKILTAEQRVRIKEIAVQLAGNNAITDAEIQKELGLTADQKTKIKNLVQRHGEANRAVFEKARDEEMDREAVMTIIQRNGNALKDELGKLLTADQASKLKVMAGKPFEADEPGRGGL